MIGRATFIASKAGGKAWTKIKTTGQKVPSWVKSNLKAIKDLKAKVKTPGWVKSKSISIGSKVEKHIGRHPKKYIAGASAVAGAGVYSKHQSLKKDGTHARLKKELKKKVA